MYLFSFDVYEYLPVCMCNICVQYSLRPAECIRSPGTSITDSCGQKSESFAPAASTESELSCFIFL